MQRSKIPLSVLAAMQCACVVEPELLNSERIERTFGNYQIQVIHSDGQLRQSVLSSENGGLVTARTFAVTRFANTPDSRIAREHNDILGGASIGATLKSAGWNVRKASIHVGEIQITDDAHPVLQMMHLEAPRTLAVHIYQLSAEKDGDVIEYATITELHHPDYLGLAKLSELFPIDAPAMEKPPQVNEMISIILEAA